jgi:short-subunit dehydrogenase
MAGGIDQRPLAVVTGASAGLGVAFARALAARGHDLVIVARRRDRLETVAAELRAAGAGVTIAARDLGVPAEVDALIRDLRDAARPVAMLVNNAGFGRYAALTAIDSATLRQLLQVNVEAVMILARELGADMHAGAGGSIINVASTASFQPVPYFSAYAATKAAVLSISEGLHLELKPKVRVLAVCPGFTKTEFHDAAGGLANHLMRMPAMDPVKVVDIALRALDRGRAVVVPGLTNKVQVLLSKFFPRAFVRWTASKLFEPRT